MSGFVIEEKPEGRTLVVTGRWSEAAERVVEQGEIDGVWLNYARGFAATDLSFVGNWPIRRLLLIERSLNDLEPIGRLSDMLEHLSVQAAPDAKVDLSALPHLRRLAASWESVRETIDAPEYLMEISAFDYDESDLTPLGIQPALHTVTLKVAPLLRSLEGVGSFPALSSLRVAAARELADLDAIGSASPTLRELDFEACPSIDELDRLRDLDEIRYLGVSDCGTVESLAPIGNLSRLETLYAWGSTRVADGDLSPLLRLRSLKEIRMRDRPGYRPRLAGVKAQLGCS